MPDTFVIGSPKAAKGARGRTGKSRAARLLRRRANGAHRLFSVVEKNRHKRKERKKLQKLPLRRGDKPRTLPPQKVQQRKQCRQQLFIQQRNKQTDGSQHPISVEKVEHRCHQNALRAVIRAEKAEIEQAEARQRGQRHQHPPTPAAAQRICQPNRQQTQQQREKDAAARPNARLIHKERIGDLRNEREDPEPQRITPPVGGVAKAVDNEKDEDRERRSADDAQGQIERVRRAKAVTDMVEQHGGAGEKPQRKSGHGQHLRENSVKASAAFLRRRRLSKSDRYLYRRGRVLAPFC